MNSPNASSRKFIDDDIKFGFAEISLQSEALYLGTPKKSQQGTSKRRSTLSFDFTTGKKKKKDLLGNLESNIFAWAEEASTKKIHRFFRDESK